MWGDHRPHALTTATPYSLLPTPYSRFTLYHPPMTPSARAHELRQALNRANQAYYVLDAPEITRRRVRSDAPRAAGAGADPPRAAHRRQSDPASGGRTGLCARQARPPPAHVFPRQCLHQRGAGGVGDQKRPHHARSKSRRIYHRDQDRRRRGQPDLRARPFRERSNPGEWHGRRGDHGEPQDHPRGAAHLEGIRSSGVNGGARRGLHVPPGL